jgi:hypothetical protein
VGAGQGSGAARPSRHRALGAGRVAPVSRHPARSFRARRGRPDPRRGVGAGAAARGRAVRPGRRRRAGPEAGRPVPPRRHQARGHPLPRGERAG